MLKPTRVPAPPLLAGVVSLLVLSSLAATAQAQLADNAQAIRGESMELFEKHVRPALIQHCQRCHGESRQRGGLRLDSRQGWSEGGDRGEALVPGDPDQSLLIQAIRYDQADLEMPPKGKLPQATIDAIERWVAFGAHDPRQSDSRPTPPKPDTPPVPSVDEGRDFWAFRPVGKPTLPAVRKTQWPANDIDHFVLAKLEAVGLVPTADADRVSLARRLHFDLTGLPPTVEQIESFCRDDSPGAYERLVDRLLDSPSFGQRWGRHWLDVVRFAESSGGGRTLLFPDAWRYRDYVIDCFNRDLPYDQFLQQQIAGDLLPYENWQDRQRNLIATGFLLLGPTNYEMQDKDILEMDVVDEQLDTIGKGMLGMTIGCARCHDHKFDPIPTYDYYAMAGILKSTKAMIHSNVSQWNTVELPLPPAEAESIREYRETRTRLKKRIAVAESSWKEAGGQSDQGSGTVPGKSVPADSLRGIVLDQPDAKPTGTWVMSTSTPGFVGSDYLHDDQSGKGDKRMTYLFSQVAAGRYEVRISYPAFSNRATRVPVRVRHRDGTTTIHVNQRQRPPIDGRLLSLGVFEFGELAPPQVVISTEGTDDGVVIADAVVLLAAGSAVASKDALESTREPARPDDAARRRIAELKQNLDQLREQLKSLEVSAPEVPLAMATGDDEDAGDIHVAIRGVVHNRGPLTPRGVLQVASLGPIPEIPQGQSGRRELAEWIGNADNPLTARVMANRVWYWLVGRGIVSSLDNFGSMGESPTHPMLLDYLAASFVENRWSVKSLIRQIVRSRTYRQSTAMRNASVAVDPDNRFLWRMNRKRLRAEDMRDAMLLVSGQLDSSSEGPGIRRGTKTEYGYQFRGKRRSVYVPVFRNTLPPIFETFDFADPNIPRGRRTESTVASQALFMMNHPFVTEAALTAAKRLDSDAQTDVTARVRRAYLEVLGREPTQEEQTIVVTFVESHRPPQDTADPWAMLYQALFQCVDFRYLN